MIAMLGQVLRKSGTVIRIVGAGCLFIVAVIGTLALDLLMSSRPHGGACSSAFMFTALLWGMVWANGGWSRSYSYREPLTLFISSIIMISMAIGLLLICGMPLIGACVAMGLGAGIGVTVLGMGLEALGKGCASCADPAQDPYVGSSYEYSNKHMSPCEEPNAFQDMPTRPVPFQPLPPPVNPFYQSDTLYFQ